MPKVSVIVPIYNAEKYMEKCIDSILNQTLNDIEVILINDGSTDNSLEIAKRYEKRDKRIIVIDQNNSGPSAARNNGIKIATGKYIGFVDSDDYIENTMYEKLFEIADKNKVNVAMCNYNEIFLYDNKKQVVKSNLKNDTVYYKEEILSEIISTFSGNKNYGFYSLWNKVYSREWLSNSNITLDINRDHGEDWWFNINVFSKIDSFICIDDYLYNYVHINKESLMIKYRENQFDLFLDGRKKLLSIIPKELINYEELNTRFIYEFSSYIIKTFKDVNEIKKQKLLINSVLNNEEVISSCKEKNKLPIHFSIVAFFIKNNFNKTAFTTYKIMSLLK